MVDNILERLIEGNNKYQWKILNEQESIKIKGKIPRYPIVILTCMDPKIDVHRIFQLNPGDVLVLRNSGNQYSEDMMRSILIAIHEYNIQYIIVLGHLDCSMKKIRLDNLMNKINSDLLRRIGQANISYRISLQKFFNTFADEIINLNNQIERLRASEDIPRDIRMIAMLYDPATGWVFNETELSKYQFYENFMKAYNNLLHKKKIDHINFLETIESEIISAESIGTKQDKKKLTPTIIEDKYAKSVNQVEEEKKVEEDFYVEAKEILDSNIDEFNLPDLEKFMTMRVNVQKPKIHIPKIRVYVPSISKSKENGKINKE